MIIKTSAFIILSLPLLTEPIQPEPIEYKSPTMTYDPFENYEKVQWENIMNSLMEREIIDNE